MKRPPTLRETLNRNAASMRFLAAMSGKPIPADDPLFQGPGDAPKRAYRPVKIGPTEHDIQNACLDYLRRVVRAEAIRYNSGAMLDTTGPRRYVRYNDAPGHSDIAGVLQGGRAFYFEVKRPGERLTDKQTKFLDRMGKVGALVGMVTSVDDCARLIKER